MRDQISHVPNLIIVWLFYDIHPIYMLLYVLPAHIHSLMNKTSYYLEADKSDAHIYSGFRLCPGLAQEYRLLLLRDLSLRSPHDTLDSGYCFRGLIITRPIRHFRNIIIINMTSYRFPSVFPTSV